MKYEFHVGDYVETKDGRVGYITKINFTYMPYFTWEANDGEPYYQEIGSQNIEEWGFRLGETFIRIGQYDFTKPEQPKEIKKLPDGYGDGYVLYKGMTEVDGTVENGWVSIGVLSSKINELVDAVNELRKK